MAAGKGFTVVDNGEATLKGFEKPVRVYEVRWRGCPGTDTGGLASPGHR